MNIYWKSFNGERKILFYIIPSYNELNSSKNIETDEYYVSLGLLRKMHAKTACTHEYSSLSPTICSLKRAGISLGTDDRLSFKDSDVIKVLIIVFKCDNFADAKNIAIPDIENMYKTIEKNSGINFHLDELLF